MITINISNDDEYHSQLNNKFFPYGTCNTTASINALRASDIDFEYPEDIQPEDYLTWILESEEAWERMRENHPWAIERGFHPRHVHQMLAWAINERLVERVVDRFSLQAKIEQILFHVAVMGCAVNVTGRFTKFGHIVTVVGLMSEQDDIEYADFPEDVDLTKVAGVIIDDPYGDYFTAYESHEGNNVLFPLDRFDWITKNYKMDRKWAHFFWRQ